MKNIIVKKLDEPFIKERNEQVSVNRYAIFVFNSGAGKIIIDSRIAVIKPSGICFIPPGVTTLFKIHEAISGYCIEFSESFFHEQTEHKEILFRLPLIFHETAGTIIHIPQKQSAVIADLFPVMAEEYSEAGDQYEKVLLSYLNILLLKCNRLLKRTPKFNKEAHYTSFQLVADYKKLINKYGCKEHFVRFYAKKMNCTANYLNIEVKKVTGNTANHLIHNYLISEIKRLLVHTKLSHKEIAAETGFYDQSYFTKFFKRYTGQLPYTWFRAYLKSDN